MGQTGLVPPIGPNSEEKTMAILAHVLQIVGWWIAPLVIFFIKRESRFVSFHALQALFLQIAYMFLIGVFVVTWFAVIFLTVAQSAANKGAPPPVGFFMRCRWCGWVGLACGPP